MADEIAPDATEVDVAAPPPPRTSNRRVALAVGALAVVAAGVFAAVSLAGSTNDPEDPVRAMFAAAERGDVLGVMEQLDPGERDALREPVTDLVDELNRLDVLHDADLSHVSGVDLRVEDLQLKSTVVRDDIARVTATGRTSGSIDVSKLPLGGFVRDLMGDGADSKQTDSMASKLDTGGDFVTTVKRGDRWYVSIGYSVAELARRDAGMSFAEMGSGVAPKGTDTPEEAVRQLVDAGTRLDARRVIELLPPGELGAVQEYAGLFLQEADDASKGADVTVSKLDLDSKLDGDHGLVYVRDAAFHASSGDVSADYADGCLDLTQPRFDAETGESAPATSHLCNGTDPSEALKGLGIDGVDPPKLSFDGKHADLGIAVVRVDGKWYVSPTRTLLGGLVAELRLFQPRDLTELGDYVQRVFEQAFSFTGSDSTVTAGSGTFDQLCAGGPGADFPQQAYDELCASRPTTTVGPGD